MLTQSPFLGQVRLVPFVGYRPAARHLARPVLGTMVSPADRSQTLSKIATTTQKLAQIRKWIASRIDQDPMLLRTFGSQVISDNFWVRDDIAVKDQWYVDQTQKQLQSENPQDWDVPEENLARTDEWALVIDQMYGGMQEFGNKPLPGPGGTPVLPGTVPVRPSGGGALTTPLPSKGISTSDILVGGAVAVGLGVLIAAIA